MKRVSCVPFTFAPGRLFFFTPYPFFSFNPWLGDDHSETCFMRPIYSCNGKVFSLRTLFSHLIKNGQLSFASPRTKPNLIDRTKVKWASCAFFTPLYGVGWLDSPGGNLSPFLEGNESLIMRELLMDRIFWPGGYHSEAGFVSLLFLLVLGRMTRLIRKYFGWMGRGQGTEARFAWWPGSCDVTKYHWFCVCSLGVSYN